MIELVKKILSLLALGAGTALIVAAQRPPKKPSRRPEKAKRRVVIYIFEATWCEECKKARPALLEMTKNHPGITFRWIDVDKDKDFALYHQVTTLPTVIATVNSKEVSRVEGVGTLADYDRMTTEAVERSNGAIPLPGSDEETKELPPGD